jgi:sterol desaturase/sphingolipid hydroxylase (fatty acid hydroxylase superfamily)
LHQNRSVLSNLHKKWNHSITAPYAFAAYYDHPVTYLILRVLPVYVPALIFRPHILTHLILLALTTLEETLVSSGYSTLPGIMIGGVARRQDRHMQSRGKGNFAPWGFMDWVHGTSVGADVMEDVMDEVEENQVKERGNRMLESATARGRERVKAVMGKGKGSRRQS